MYVNMYKDAGCRRARTPFYSCVVITDFRRMVAVPLGVEPTSAETSHGDTMSAAGVTMGA